MESSAVPAGTDLTGELVAEDAPLASARARAAEVGCVPITPAGGAVLRLLAASVRARAVVEIGTGTGVSGLYVLRGMRPDGVLTSIDVEPEYQRLARAAFRDAGIGPGRFRLINGRARDVLPRLADASYDLVSVVDGAPAEYPDHLVEALRLLRPGGIVAFDGVLRNSRVADPTARDPESLALRELIRTVRDSDALIPALLPVGPGLLAAVKRD